jgi:hypothetical protein
MTTELERRLVLSVEVPVPDDSPARVQSVRRQHGHRTGDT